MSDRPLAEARLLENEVASVTLDSIGEAVVRTDMFGNVAYTNRIAERMIGWTREEALGRPVADVLRIIDGVSRAAIRNVMEIVMQGGKIASATTNSINLFALTFLCFVSLSIAQTKSTKAPSKTSTQAASSAASTNLVDPKDKLSDPDKIKAGMELKIP